ncbi:MAG: hypothetical protein ACO1RX_05995 [Candidatus Sericytochromatia bacterium]
MSQLQIRNIDRHHDADLARFIDIPWQIYPVNRWVPPLKASVAAELSDNNLFFREGQVALFLAERGGEPVGRISASVDASLADPQLGYFGYFECADDPEAARALLQAAEDWLRTQGRSQAHGPVNLNIYGGYRLQTAGFDTPPFLGEPRAPEYYAALLTAAGYVPHLHWHSWDIHTAQLQPMHQYMQHKAAAGLAPYTFESLATTPDAAQFLEQLREVAMAIFAENYGYTPLDQDAFLQAYAGLLGVFQRHPDLLGMYFFEGQPVAFGFIYPDYAPFFQAANGDATALAQFGQAKAHTMVFHSFGILREHRHSVLPYQMFAQGLPKLQELGLNHAIGALAKEGRTAYDQLGSPSRSYSLYRRAL